MYIVEIPESKIRFSKLSDGSIMETYGIKSVHRRGRIIDNRLYKGWLITFGNEEDMLMFILAYGGVRATEYDD